MQGHHLKGAQSVKCLFLICVYFTLLCTSFIVKYIMIPEAVSLALFPYM
jgi:hypothetical protein